MVVYSVEIWDSEKGKMKKKTADGIYEARKIACGMIKNSKDKRSVDIYQYGSRHAYESLQSYGDGYFVITTPFYKHSGRLVDPKTGHVI